MSEPTWAELWESLAEDAEGLGLPHMAEDYRRLAGLQRLQDDIDQMNQASYREYFQQGIINGPNVYMAPAGSDFRAGELTPVGWIDETHIWKVDQEQDGDWGGEVLRRIRSTSHTVDFSFTDPDGGRRLGLLFGGLRDPRQDYRPAEPPYKGLREAIDRHCDRYIPRPRL